MTRYIFAEANVIDKFKFVEEEYLSLLELAYEVTESIKGKTSQDGRKPDCQNLAIKLYAHTATAYWLYKGTNAPVPASTGGSHFIDFSSIAVIARAALETYLTFFEVFIAPGEDEDEFEFQYCLWHLAGKIIFETMGQVDSSLQENYEMKMLEIEELRNRLRATIKFGKLTQKEQNNILKGTRMRDWEKIAKSAGFGYQFI